MRALHVSRYRGDVFIKMKMRSIEPSSPLRHILELLNIIKMLGFEKAVPTCFISSRSFLLPSSKCVQVIVVFCSFGVQTVFFSFTDGGADHNVSFWSVICAWICLCIILKPEMLVAIRTAGGRSYINFVERIMALALAREKIAGTNSEGRPFTVMSEDVKDADILQLGQLLLEIDLNLDLQKLQTAYRSNGSCSLLIKTAATWP
jgi:hypothetical protein